MIYKNISKSLILILSIFYTTIVFSDEKIFYIDLDYIMNNSLAGKAIINELDKKNKKNLDRFIKIEEDLKKEEIKIISQKNILNKGEYEIKIKSFKNKVFDYKQTRKTELNNLKKSRENAQISLANSLKPIIAKYTQENSISFILNKQSIIIGKTELDLTKTILEILDSKIKNVKIK
jgi:Skp family chaperone for outer membrane proteins